jgi:polyisoprenoid-binding protein YceI
MAALKLTGRIIVASRAAAFRWSAWLICRAVLNRMLVSIIVGFAGAEKLPFGNVQAGRLMSQSIRPIVYVVVDRPCPSAERNHEMKTRAKLPVAIALLVLGGAPQAPGAELYNIDPTHTSIVFSVAHSGLSYVYGFFRQASGAYILDETNPDNCRFQLAIRADSIDTNNADRDKHLRGEDFLNVQKRECANITFESTRVQRTNAQEGIVYQVTGNLTIHGETRQVTFPLRMLGAGQGPYGDQRTGFLCQLDIKRSDFGMTTALDKNLVGDAVGITVSFEGILQQPGAQQGTR